jgi:hypothetical protein
MTTNCDWENNGQVTSGHELSEAPTSGVTGFWSALTRLETELCGFEALAEKSHDPVTGAPASVYVLHVLS